MTKKPYLTDADFEDTGPAKSVETGVLGRLGDLGLSAVKSAIAVPEMGVGLANLVSGGKAGKAVENAGVRFKDAKEILDSKKSVAAQLADRRFQEAEGFTGKLGAAVQNPSLISNAVVESAAPMLAGGVVGRGLMGLSGRVSPVVAGAAGEGAVGAGMAAESIRQQTDDGELTGKQSLLAGATGLTTGLLGYGGAKAAKALGVGDIDSAIVGGTRTLPGQAAQTAPGALSRIGRGALTEGVFEELPQSVAEQALQNAALDRDLTEGLDGAAAMGLVSGAAMGGGMGLLTNRQSPPVPPPSPNTGTGTPPPAPGAGPAAGPGTPGTPGALPTAGQPPLGASLTGTPVADLLGGQVDPLQAVLQSRQQPPTGAPLTDTPIAGLLGERRDPIQDVLAGRQAQPLGEAPIGSPVGSPTGAPLTDTPMADLLGGQPNPLAGLAPLTRTPAQELGIDAAAGPLSAAAATAVNGPARGLSVLGTQSNQSPPALNQPKGTASASQADQAQQATPQRPEAQPPVANGPLGTAANAAPGAAQPVGAADAGVSGELPGTSANPSGALSESAPLTRARTIEPGPAVVLQNRDRSSAASVAQMNEIAASPDYLRAGQASVMDSGAPVVFGDAPETALVGREAPVADGRGQRTQTQYMVVEAADLLASNLADGTRVPEYEQGQPGKLRAVAGNGRAAGITEAYSRGTAGQYKADLVADAQSLGMEPAAIEAMRSPVLVRVMSGNDVTADEGLTAPTQADIEAQQERTESADTLGDQEQIKRESEVGDTSFMTGFAGDGRQDTTGDIFGSAPEAAPEAPTTPQPLSTEPGSGITRIKDAARKKALDRIASGSAYFSTADKANDFITKNDLADTHEAVKAKPGRFEVRAKVADAPAPAAPTPAPTASPAASANTVFTEDAAAKARARLKAKLGRLNSGIDPEMLMDGITLAGYHIEKGARTFAAYARAMVDDLGDGVKPYLQSWYMAVRADPRAAAFKPDMDKASLVEDLDIDEVLAAKPTKPPAVESDATQDTDVEFLGDNFNEKDLDEPSGRDGWQNIGDVSGNDGVSYPVDFRDIRKVNNGTPTAIRQIRIYNDNSGSSLAAWEWRTAKLDTGALGGLAIDAAIFNYVLSDASESAFGNDASDGDALWSMYGPEIMRALKRSQANPAAPTPSTPPMLEGVKPSLDTTEGRHAVAKLVSEHLMGDNKFATITEARKFIADKTGSKVEPGSDQAKRADEAIELGVVIAARDIVEASRKQGRSDEVIYDRLLGLYESQPSLNVRDSVSLRNQAYSTPVPLAFVASRLAQITPKKKVGEPTAGNGALMMEASPANATVNEIQDDRLEALRVQGFKPTQNDAAVMAFAPKSLDSMAMNPPFGPLNGQKWTFGDFTTGEIDHAIVLNSLEALKDDGNAVLIIGGTLAQADGARKIAYRGKAKREFFFTLYGQYNVVDHFTVSGDLYKKQGAAFPVDVLVIRGRGKSSRGLPAAQLPQLIDTWEQLKGKLNEASSVGTDRAGSAGGNSTASDADAQPPVISGASAAAPGVAGRRDGRVGPDASVGPAAGGRVAGNAAGATGATGTPDPAGQRGNADAPAQPGNTRRDAAAGDRQQQGGANSTRSNQPAGVDAGSRVGTDSAGVNEAAASGRLQVKYANFSGNRSVNTLVATNHLSAIDSAFTKLKEKVGDIDEFVRAELQYEPEQFKKSFSAEQVEALALAIDNIGQGKGFIIGDQTGTGKGRVVAAMIRYAKLNGKTPVFVTQMPDLYGDMMRDLNDIGMGNTTPLMTNNNASVPLDAEALSWFSEKQGIQTRITELLDAMEGVALDEMGEKATTLAPDERAKSIAQALKTSTNPEMVSLREEIKELKASLPERRGKFLDTPAIESHEKSLRQMVQSNSIGDYDVIFTTYNQMAALDSGKPKKNKETGVKTPASAPVFGYRSAFLSHFVNANSMLILDESHNAGEAGDGKFPKVGDVVRQMIAKSGGVFYSSATFAKNTAVMDVYSKTDLGSAFDTPGALVAAVNSVPMQQITSSMLVEAGQYLRRERSFDGIEYKTETVEVDQQAAEDMAQAMRLVVDFDSAKKEAIAELQSQLDAEGGRMAAVDGGGSMGSVDSMNFTSVMHNVVNTFLLALKADAAAQSAIDAIRAGEKPVITVANTMEMFITEFAKESGLGVGDKLNATFADVLKRYLEKTRKASIQHANGDSEVIRLTDAQLGFLGVNAYNDAYEFIDEMDLDIPLSPIDHIKQRIEEAGLSIGEITGRQTVVVNGVLRSRNKAELNTAGKKNTIAKYNGGTLDALIINRSGSTGLSMHASETFADQRRRVMIVAQAELDINNHMQMLGRINRTGQVTANGKSSYAGPAQYGLPRYAQMTANVPIELRPAAVLSNKMAGLNANTTAGRKSSVEDKSALDFMNKYGDRVAAEMVGGNSQLNGKLGYPIKMDENGSPFVPGAISKVTGRIGLLPLAEQTELYSQLAIEYGELIAQLDALGQNDLEAKTYPLDAETLENKVIQKADDKSASPFTSAVSAEKVSMKKLGKPYPKAKVLELVEAQLKGRDAMEVRRKTLSEVSNQIQEEVNALSAQLPSATAMERTGIQRGIDALNAAAVRFRQTLPALGVSVMLKTDAGNLYGIVTKIDRTGKAKSAGSLSAWKVQVAVVDGARSMTLPLTQLYVGSDADIPANGVGLSLATDMTIPNAARTGFDTVSVMEAFDRGQTDSRETRVIITGNILRGYGVLRGRLLNYTDNKGGIKQGILMPADFDMNAVQARFTPSLKSSKEVIALLDKGGTVIDKSNSGDTLRISKKTGPYVVEVSKTGLGKKLAKNAGDLNFVSSGNRMRVRVWDADVLTNFLDKTVKPEGIALVPDSDSAKLVDGGAFSRATSQTASQTDTPAFKKWFGDSKVVDADGKPLRMYHGTSKDGDFSKFKIGPRGAWFTSDPEIASEYAEENDSQGSPYNPDTRRYDPINTASRVLPVYLSISNPYRLTAADAQRVNVGNYAKAQRELFAEIKAKGHDGVLWNDNLTKEWVVLVNSGQIKSATGNRGTFDPANPDIRLSRTGQQATSISKSLATQIVDAIKARWANAPEIVVVANMQDAAVPKAVRDEDAKQRSQGAAGEPEGFFYGGKVYVVAGALNSPGDVVRVLFHESLGHYGLRGVFGDSLAGILNQIATMRRGEVIAKAREYGLVGKGEDGKPLVDVKTASNAEVWAAMNADLKNQAAEEVLAVMAQARPELGFVKRAIAAIRAFLRKNIPGFGQMKLTDEDIVARFILPARAFVERGGRGAAGALPAMSRNAASRTQAQSVNRNVGDAPPAEAQRVQAAIEGKGLIEAARFLTQSSNKARAAVAQKVVDKLVRLERAGVDLKLNIAHRGDMAPAAMANSRGYTETGFDEKGRDIEVWLNGADVVGKVGTEEEVLLHELVHAATTGMVFYGQSNPNSLAGKHARDLVAVTDAIFEHIDNRFADADAGKVTLTEFELDMRAGANNAFHSEDEVLAWALSNAEAQQYLEGIPYKAGSMWSGFVQAVRTLLGLSPANDTALSEVLRVADRLMTEDAPQSGRAAFWHKRGMHMVQQQGRGSLVQRQERAEGADPTNPDIRFSRTANGGVTGAVGRGIDRARDAANAMAGRNDARAADMADLTDEQRALLGKIGSSPTPAADAIRSATDRAGLKIRQGMLDRYAALKDLDERTLGANFLDTAITDSSWVLAKMASAASGALNGMMNVGRIQYNISQKVIEMKGEPDGGLTGVLKKLGPPAEVERFFGWVAANRASKLLGEDRENLFTPDEIIAGMAMNTGDTAAGQPRAALYAAAFNDFQKYRDDVLAIAEAAGIISDENRAMWRDEFYVPFYRVMDEDAKAGGPGGGGGLSRQEAFKRLKGGRQNLNDLMENTLMNFHHLLSASLKNQAAAQAMKNADLAGLARVVPESRRDTKTSTFVLSNGKKVFYQVDDPLVFEAITTLSDPGLNSTAVKVMSAFKRVFTQLTTVTPQFIIANTFRDLLQATATSPTSKNIGKNLAQGIKSYQDEKIRAEMLASGGAFSFGHIYGMDADEIRASLRKTVSGAQLISDPSMIPGVLRKGWAAWDKVVDASENISRAATYVQNVDQLGKLRAAFEARDVMDFSQHGAWPAVRFMIRVVPFLNARLQGLDKLYRSGLKPSILTAMGKGSDTDKQAAARFATVTGALTVATLALYMANADDEEYQKLEEWQKDTYWFFRIGGNAYFLPKPFEVGAIATLAERTLQQAMDEKATGRLFGERMKDMLMQTFAFNPVPQMFQPVMDIYSNRDAFTGRDIETTGMERLSLGMRARDTTTAPARAISEASRVLGDKAPFAISPVQADHLIKGYLGGLGASAAGILDTMHRAAIGLETPDRRFVEYQPIRRFYRDLETPVANTRYSTLFYDGLREVNRVYADVRELQKLGRPEEAQELAAKRQNALQMRIALNANQRKLTDINNRLKAVRRSDNDGEWKRREVDLLNTRRELITERMGKMIENERASRWVVHLTSSPP